MGICTICIFDMMKITLRAKIVTEAWHFRTVFLRLSDCWRRIYHLVNFSYSDQWNFKWIFVVGGDDNEVIMNKCVFEVRLMNSFFAFMATHQKCTIRTLITIYFLVFSN